MVKSKKVEDKPALPAHERGEVIRHPPASTTTTTVRNLGKHSLVETYFEQQVGPYYLIR